MKNIIEELQLGTADVTVITPKILSDTIEEIARHKRIFAQFYKENRDLMKNGGTAVEFPKKESGITATFDVAPGAGPSPSKMQYSAVTISVKKGAIGLAFRGEAIRQANRDVIRDAIEEAGEVWADTLDLVALQAMFPSATAGTIAGSVVTLQPYPIAFLSVNGSGTLVVDSNGAATLTASASQGCTVTYLYIPATNAEGDPVGARRVTTTGGSLSAKDLLSLRGDIIAKKYDPDVFVIHPDRLADIFYDPNVKFLEKSAYEGQGVIFTGELGKIWGVKVVVSNKAPKYGVIAIDSDKLGYHVIRKPLNLVRDDYTGMSIDTLYFWGFAEENFGVVNAQAYGAVALRGTITIDSSVVQ